MKRAAFYARVSATGETIDDQLRELEAVAKRHGWEVVDRFIDQGNTGGKGKEDRPALGRLVNAAIREEVDVVAAFSVEQLGRSLRELVGFLETLRDRGVDLYLHRQELDTATPQGQVVYQALDLFAGFERSIIVERVKAGMTRAKEQGKRLSRPTVDEWAIQRMRKLRAEGHSLRWIAEEVGVGRGTVEKYVKRV
jgi:DNA invertase Pin-like site-specific DNA recombinase